jgi:hypothetical protein
MSKEERIEVAGKHIVFADTRVGKLHKQLRGFDLTSMDEKFREVLLAYMDASESAVRYNMKSYEAMQEFIEGLLLTQSMTQRGVIIGVTFPEQKKVLQHATDSMLMLIGKKINQENG